MTAPTSVPPKAGTRAVGKHPRLQTFVRVLFAITCVVHIPFAIGVAHVADRLHLPRPAAWAALAFALGVTIFRGPVARTMHDSHHPRWRVNLVDLPYYAHWCAALGSALLFALAAIVGLIALPFTHSITDRLPAVAAMTYAATLALCIYGVFVRRVWARTERIDVAIRDLPPELDGFRIAHLSDLHIGTYTPLRRGLAWAKRANALDADVAVVTGDLVTNGVAFHEEITQAVGALRAKLGVFVSMGNHDYFGEGEPLVTLLRAAGVTVLRNEGLVLAAASPLFLSAIDDTWSGKDDLVRALSARPAGVPTVLLAHDPERFRRAAREDVDLVLAGHTHGGQIALPFFARHVTLSKLTHHFHLGIYRSGRSTLYVHPGLGTTGPPIRIGVAPAVTLLTLRAG